jgi:hypothetical protein
LSAIDGKNGPDGDVGVDIGTSVERVEVDDVVSLRIMPGNLDDVGLFLRAQRTDLA